MKSLSFTLCLAAIALLAGCGNSGAPPAQPDAANGAGSGLQRVTAGHPVRKPLQLDTVQPARVEAFEETPLVPKVTAFVKEVAVDIGDRVKQDQVLIRLSAPEMVDEHAQKVALVAQAEADIRQAEAAIAAAQAAQNSAQAQLAGVEAGVVRSGGELARWKAESERIASLVESGVVTQKLADETLNQLRSAEGSQAEAQAAIEAAKAMVAQAEAGVRKAEADKVAAEARRDVAKADLAKAATMLQYLEIKSPFDGVVTRRTVDTGHYVHPPTGSASEPLMVVARTDVMRVFADIPETEAGLVTCTPDESDAVTVFVQALGNKRFEGEVTRTSWSLNRANRSLTTEIDIPNEDGALRPGMYATLQMCLDKIPDALTLPASAIIREDAGIFCAVVENGVIARRPLELGLRVGDEIQVKSGVTEADLVVLARAADLAPGQKVEVIGAGDQ